MSSIVNITVTTGWGEMTLRVEIGGTVADPGVWAMKAIGEYGIEQVEWAIEEYDRMDGEVGGIDFTVTLA